MSQIIRYHLIDTKEHLCRYKEKTKCKTFIIWENKNRHRPFLYLFYDGEIDICHP